MDLAGRHDAIMTQTAITTGQDAKLSALKYYGGKNRPGIQARVLGALSPNEGFLDAFSGSGAILLNRPRSRFEVMNDVDGLAVNFFRALRDRPDDLIEAFRLTPFARAERTACKDALKAAETLDDIERARCWYIDIAMSKHGLASSGTTIEPAMARQFAERVRKDFRRIADRLRGVMIECRDGVDLIRERAGSPDWTIYCDPPYPISTRGRGDRRYPHEHSPELDERLLDAVQGAEAQIVISSYANELYDSRLAGLESHRGRH